MQFMERTTAANTSLSKGTNALSVSNSDDANLSKARSSDDSAGQTERPAPAPRRILFVTVGNSSVRLVTYLDRRAIQEGLGAGERPKFEEIADRILNKTPTGTDVRTSYDSGNVGYHVQVHQDLIYLAVCLRGYPRQLAFDFLQQVREQFETRYAPADLRRMTKPDALDAAFRPTLKALTQTYTTRQDKIAQLQGEVRDIHAVMQRNIEDVLERGERLDDLVEQADALRNTAGTFQRQSGTLKKRMCQKNVAAASCIIVLVILIILAIVLGVVLTHRH